MPRQVDTQQRRREIAYGVLAVIAEGGLGAVSLRSVASAAGVSMGRVQHYFASKRELILHACRTVMDLADEQQEPARNEAPAQEQLRHLLLLGLPDSPASRYGVGVWYAFVVAATTDDELAGLVSEGWQNLRDEAEALLSTLGVEDAPAYADLLAATVDGLVLRVALGSLAVGRARALMDLQIESVLRATPRQQ